MSHFHCIIYIPGENLNNYGFQGSLQTGRKQDSETEPWFDRFMKMANALYDRATKSGIHFPH